MTDETMNQEALTVEQSFARLEEMVKMLERDDVSLEDSFHIYENGMKMLKAVSEKIEAYEKKMQILTADGEAGEFK